MKCVITVLGKDSTGIVAAIATAALAACKYIDYELNH